MLKLHDTWIDFIIIIIIIILHVKSRKITNPHGFDLISNSW